MFVGGILGVSQGGISLSSHRAEEQHRSGGSTQGGRAQPREKSVGCELGPPWIRIQAKGTLDMLLSVSGANCTHSLSML